MHNARRKMTFQRIPFVSGATRSGVIARGIYLFIAVSATALAAGSAPSVPDEMPYTPGGDWAMYNKTLDGQRYSPLTQINVKNGKSLTEVCRVKIADTGGF